MNCLGALLNFYSNQIVLGDPYAGLCALQNQCYLKVNKYNIVLPYLSTFENFPGVESARQLVSDILHIARGRYK